MARMAAASTFSPSTPATTPAAMRIQMTRLSNWASRIRNALVPGASVSSFFPLAARRSMASLVESPAGVELKWDNTSSVER